VVDQLFEVYVWRSIAETIKAALPTTYVIEPGMRRAAPEDKQEWVTIDPLSFSPANSRRGTYDGQELFQVSCFAKYAETQPDAVLDVPFRLAAKVRAALEKGDILVKSYGVTPEVFIGTLKLHAFNRQYLGENALGIDQPANAHAVVLTAQGTLNAA